MARFDNLRTIESLDPERDHQRIGGATRDLFAPWVPHLAAPIVRYGIYAILDDDMLAAFGFPRPLPFTRPALRKLLRFRGALVRWLPTRRQPHFFSDDRNRTHPRGYQIAELGPPRLIAAKTRRREADAPREQ